MTRMDNIASSPDDAVPLNAGEGKRVSGSADELRATNKGADSWDRSTQRLIDKSEKRAWGVAFAAVVVAILLAVAIVIMMPLKAPPVPYVWREDTATGHMDQITVLEDKIVTGDEVRDRYWVGLYVSARESYDWMTLQHDYDLVGALSAPNAGAEYKALFEGKNALDKVLGKDNLRRPEILSKNIVSPGVMLVRFIRWDKKIDDPTKGTPSCFAATVAYTYGDNSRMKQSLRDINPYGYQTLSYRAEPEVCGADK